MKTKNKIQYGKVEIPAEAFESKNVKERITIFLDEDVVNEFRARATATGKGYQTLINETLRGAVFQHEQATDIDLPRSAAEALRELIESKDELLELAAEHREKKRA